MKKYLFMIIYHTSLDNFIEMCVYWDNIKNYPKGTIVLTKGYGMITVEHHSNGNIMIQWRCDNNDDVLHSQSDMPTVIHYYRSGQVRQEIYLKHGISHRLKYPADISYDKIGNVTQKEYWWHGHNITSFIKKLVGEVPDKLTNDQIVLLKLSLPEECFKYDV